MDPLASPYSLYYLHLTLTFSVAAHQLSPMFHHVTLLLLSSLILSLYSGINVHRTFLLLLLFCHYSAAPLLLFYYSTYFYLCFTFLIYFSSLPLQLLCFPVALLVYCWC